MGVLRAGRPAAGRVDRHLAERGLERRIVAVVPSFAAALAMTAQSDLTALAPRRLAALLAGPAGLTIYAPPAPPRRRREPSGVSAPETGCGKRDAPRHTGAVMTQWFTADLHLGHANVIGYSQRPWADVAAMNAGLVERWNALVEPDDTVWVLGDVAMGSIAETLPLVARLRGHKRLVAGNHDRCWAGHGAKAAAWTERYRDAGFEAVQQGPITLAIGEHRVLVDHFPYRGDSHDHDRYVEQRPPDRGRWLLHGHVHERWRQRGRMINVGVDAWDQRPVSEAALTALIDAGHAELAPLGHLGPT